MLKRKYGLVDGKPYFECTKTNLQFVRTIATLAWPYGDTSGCFLVLGESRHAPPTLGSKRPLYLLHEYLSLNTTELIQQVFLQRNVYLYNSVITPTDDKRFIFCEHENDLVREQGRYPMSYDSPENWQGNAQSMLSYYIAVLGKRIARGEEKSLYFKLVKNSESVEQALSVGHGDLKKQMVEYPALCSLCWALDFIENNPYRKNNNSKSYFQTGDLCGGY